MQKNEKVVNKIEFYELFQQFKKDCNCKIDKNFFYNIYYNAKFFPYYNSFSDITSYPYYLKSVYLKTKGKLPQAIRNLYNKINKDTQKITKPTELEIKILNELKSKGFFVIEKKAGINVSVTKTAINIPPAEMIPISAKPLYGVGTKLKNPIAEVNPQRKSAGPSERDACVSAVSRNSLFANS